MLKLFKKLFKKDQTTPEFSNVHLVQDGEGWIYPQTAEELLKPTLRQKYLNILWQQVSMDKKTYHNTYNEPIKRYAEMVQLLPASESHHHSHIGGMLDHGLEVVAFAARLRQSYVLPPNSVPEEQSKQRDAWTAAIVYAALVHDIGKVIVDLEITLQDGSKWMPWNGIPPLPYKFGYIKNRNYNLHPVIGSFLANQLIPKAAFNWLRLYPEAFASLMYAMSGHSDKAGVLSEIIQKADQYSVTLALGGDVNKLVQRPVNSLTKQLVTALRYLLQHKLKVNTNKGPGDGWYTEDGLWLMSKTIADNVRTYLLEQGISVPSDNLKLFDELQALGIVETTPDGTAIWHCRVKTAKWTSDKTFRLLKVKPEVAWEKIDDRPEYLIGKVIVEADCEEANLKENETALSPEAAQITPEEIQTKAKTALVALPDAEADLTEQLLNMFEPTTSEAITETKPTEKIEAIKTTEAETEPSQAEKPKYVAKKEISSGKQPATHDGLAFVEWLKTGIATKKLVFNKNTARLHVVNNALFLISPAIFEQYLQETGKPYDEEAITNLQYSFQDLGLHTPKNITVNGKPDKVNFWRCKVAGPRRTSYLSGYLLKNTSLFFGEQQLVPNNLFLTIEKEEP